MTALDTPPTTRRSVRRRPAETAAASRAGCPVLRVIRVLEDIYRVDDADRTVGYIQLAGSVYVALRGEVYNMSIEIAQCLDLDSAVDRLRTT